jgi:hypothetical protein
MRPNKFGISGEANQVYRSYKLIYLCKNTFAAKMDYLIVVKKLFWRGWVCHKTLGLFKRAWEI